MYPLLAPGAGAGSAANPLVGTVNPALVALRSTDSFPSGLAIDLANVLSLGLWLAASRLKAANAAARRIAILPLRLSESRAGECESHARRLLESTPLTCPYC